MGSSTSTCSRSPVTSRCILGPPVASLRLQTPCERRTNLPRLLRPLLSPPPPPSVLSRVISVFSRLSRQG
eukprot:4641932-Pleurochrysis_carterae.AAC.5